MNHNKYFLYLRYFYISSILHFLSLFLIFLESELERLIFRPVDLPKTDRKKDSSEVNLPKTYFPPKMNFSPKNNKNPVFQK